MSIRPPLTGHHVVVVLLVAVIALAGCGAPFGSPAPTSTPDAGAVQPLAFPSPPTPLTEASVGGYVAAYEEVYRHNAILAANSGVTAVYRVTPGGLTERVGSTL